MADRHKSGPLKQKNKPHKHGRHKSKGEISTQAKGRVSLKVATGRLRKGMGKADKRNRMKQLRDRKRQETTNAKRAVGIEGSPPHLVVVLAMSASVDFRVVHSLLTAGCEAGEDETTPFAPVSTLVCGKLKQRFTFAFPESSNLYALLDTAKVADSLLLVYMAGQTTEECPQLILDCIYAQGLPTVLHVAQGLETLSAREQTIAKKSLQRDMEKRFPSAKLHTLDSVQDAGGVLRQLCVQKRQHVSCRDLHPHLLVEAMSFSDTNDKGEGVLKVSGYLRGRGLSVNGLVHIPAVGDFQMLQIDAPRDPHPLKPPRKVTSSSMAVDSLTEEDMEEDIKVLEVADPAKQESLVSEVVPDPMAGEQTWPSKEDLKEAAGGRCVVKRRLPAGTSDYQAAWILDSGSEDEDNDASDGEESDVAPPLIGSESESEGDGDGMSIAESEIDTLTLPDTDKYDNEMDTEGDRKQLERLRAEREDQQFPDEMDTPLDISARVRFQKYRGLKSFRSSPWDRYENLPLDYARIFQFDNFNRTKKRVLSREDDEGAMPGWYITLHISNVPKSFTEKCDLTATPMVVYALLQHENKMSVVHFALMRTPGYVQPIRSKDQLVFHCGVRRFAACPIFSQHTAGDKHKFERYFKGDAMTVATVFAPVSYPPQPVLVFKHEHGRQVLVASGSVFKVDPRRVACKRVVLSGHPLKINKKSAVIRYMFFNREDVMWFKPVELRTKYGRRGHIKEPLGTHGHMKCVFDGQVKAQDTVLMNLYKRVYPKWTYTPNVPHVSGWHHDNDNSHEDSEDMT